jgi:hypothetical protein
MNDNQAAKLSPALWICPGNEIQCIFMLACVDPKRFVSRCEKEFLVRKNSNRSDICHMLNLHRPGEVEPA